MVGLDGGNTLFDTVEETGGSADISISGTTDSHTLTIAEMPSHTHSLPRMITNVSFLNFNAENGGFEVVTGALTDPTGGGQGHTHGITFDGTDANYQPFITVYMWKRTA